MSNVDYSTLTHLTLSEIEDMVDAAIRENCKNNKSFTAYDITKAIRDKGNYVNHKHVRELVHSFFENDVVFDSSYQRRVKSNLDSVNPPYEYYDSSVDENDVNKANDVTDSTPVLDSAPTSVDFKKQDKVDKIDKVDSKNTDKDISGVDGDSNFLLFFKNLSKTIKRGKNKKDGIIQPL